MSADESGNLGRASVGRRAPDFALPDTQGATWRLADHLGRPLLLVFHRHLQ